MHYARRGTWRSPGTPPSASRRGPDPTAPATPSGRTGTGGRCCGVLAPTAFVGAWVTGGLLTEGYDPVRQAISQLAREGAPTRA
jgi:hypothetical protein